MIPIPHGTVLVKKLLLLPACLLLLAALAPGCREQRAADSRPGMANPASVHCLEQGGRLEIRQGPGGGQVGVCVFDDGSECGEWALFRGECRKGDRRSAPQSP